MVVDLLFKMAQSLYFAENLAYDSLYLKKPRYVEKKEPKSYKRVHSMVPLYEEPESILRANFESQLNSDYPRELIDIYPVVEEKDTKTVEIVTKLSKEIDRIHPIIIPNNGQGDWKNVIEKWSKNEKSCYDGNMDLPFGKGRALTYAYYTESSDVRDADILTIFDAEDIIDPDLFKYSIAGLEQGIDIVQGKIRYRNKSANLLSALEATEPVIWSNQFYNHTSGDGVPYQVLGPAYFFDAKLPERIGGWSPYTTSEDVEFGLRCWEDGRRLGVLDVYTDELGVESLGAWFKQRRRWARGHQKVFLSNRLRTSRKLSSIKSTLHFYSYTLNSQLMSVTNLIGLPTGLYTLAETLSGTAPHMDPIMTGITLFNLANWMYTAVSTSKSLGKVGEFKDTKEKLKYYMMANPLTLMFYSALWAVPVAAGAKDCIDSRRGKKITWEKTPREGCQ